jgi:hypothetical protein
MNRRSLLLLGTAAVVAIGGALLADREDAPPPGALPGTGPGGLAFPDLARRLAGAARIEVKKPDATLVLQRDGDRWLLPDKGGYPVRPEKVRELLVGLTELKLLEPRTADPAQLARLGLDDPATPGSTALLLRVLDAAGAPIAELVIGRRRVRTQGNVPESAYVRRPGENQSWLAEGRLPIDADANLWLDRDIANIPGGRLRRLEARRPEAPEVVIARPADDPAGALEVVAPADAPKPPDEITLDEISRAFEFITFLDVRPAAQIPGEALGEAVFAYSDDLGVVARPHGAGEDLWVMLEARGDTPEAKRLAARWAGWAYQVGPWKQKAFLPRVEDLRPREPATPEAPAGLPGLPGLPGGALPPGHPPAALPSR